MVLSFFLLLSFSFFLSFFCCLFLSLQIGRCSFPSLSVSLACISFILFMLGTEIYTYLTPELTTQLFVSDGLHEEPVSVFLNISFPNVECLLLTLDIEDDLGRHDSGENQNEVKLVPLNEARGCRLTTRFYLNKVPGNFHVSSHVSLESGVKPTQENSWAHNIHQLHIGDVVEGSIVFPLLRGNKMSSTFFGKMLFRPHPRDVLPS